MSLQVVEIGKGSKVKYELDKKTGLIKVRAMSNCFLCFALLPLCHNYHVSFMRAGRPCAVLIGGLSPQLWVHPAHSL